MVFNLKQTIPLKPQICQVENCLNLANLWLQRNGLRLNILKTEYVHPLE